MRRILAIVGAFAMMSISIAGCGSASASSGQTANEPNIAIEVAKETEDISNDQSVEQSEPAEPQVTVETENVAELAKTQSADVGWQDYVDSDGVFNLDQYAEALGYTVMKADKSRSWYIMDTIQCHYCIVTYRDTLNIMFDSPDAGYGINVVDNYDLHERTEPQRIQNDTFDVSKCWIEEASSLLAFVAKNNPSEEDVHAFPNVGTLRLTCTKYSGGFVTDERGVIVDGNGSAELFWKKNW